MKTITTSEAPSIKRAAIKKLEDNRQFAGNAATDQRIEFILNMSDEEYVEMYNEVVRREELKSAKAKAKKAEISAERKATGKSKKAYREEYDALMKQYKETKNEEYKKAAKAIAKYAF